MLLSHGSTCYWCCLQARDVRKCVSHNIYTSSCLSMDAPDYYETTLPTKTHSHFKRRVKSHLPFASIIRRFKVYGSGHRKYIPIYVYIQQDATLQCLFISGKCSTCFGWYFHPSSGSHTTASTASGTCHTVTAICRYRGRDGTGLSTLKPIIRSAYNCIYSIRYLSYRYCYLPLSWKSWNRVEGAVGGVGRYRCVRS
jgi:hypothetical protein